MASNSANDANPTFETIQASLSKVKNAAQLQELMNINSDFVAEALVTLVARGRRNERQNHLRDIGNFREYDKQQIGLEEKQAQVDVLKTLVASLERRLAALQYNQVENREDLKSELRRAQKDLDHERKTVVYLRDQLRNQQTQFTAQRSPAYRDPTPFGGAHGQSPMALQIYLMELRLKLHANRDWWTDESDRMRYVLSTLEGSPKLCFAQFVNSDGTFREITTVEEIMDQLQKLPTQSA
ncbi:hypothetical protein HYFRA_00011486 [Hymenoscyphus fraxineus]|uniref:Uncharacterized protein n=1 Tax=Hymenoscyphus fraxineus TaxID=746836 RepID=A0A9N9L1R0_9HELO|nr:hypothetical protein HYFRA_00011486 [Hymenoscyphus fraxineus]